jgi:hypothetical protein
MLKRRMSPEEPRPAPDVYELQARVDTLEEQIGALRQVVTNLHRELDLLRKGPTKTLR